MITFRQATQKAVLPVALVTLLSACNYDGNLSGIHWFLDMHDSYAVEAQEEDITTLDNVKGEGWSKGSNPHDAWGGPGSSMRVPPEGTVARDSDPYPFGPMDFDQAAATLVNPLPVSMAVMERGKKQYEIFCALCHGFTGKGDGSVVPPFPTPPNLLTGMASTEKDGWIYHMITMGRGAMKPYAAQIDPVDRWSIVHYIRALQKSEN